jgi:hypothetical protein
MAFWESVKGDRDPAVLVAYPERYPKDEFAPTARALIVQFEQELRAERATREEAGEEQRAVAIRAVEEAKSRAKMASSPTAGDEKRYPDNFTEAPWHLRAPCRPYRNAWGVIPAMSMACGVTRQSSVLGLSLRASAKWRCQMQR